MWSPVVPASVVSFLILMIFGMWLVNVEKPVLDSSKKLINEEAMCVRNTLWWRGWEGKRRQSDMATVLLLHWYSWWISSSQAPKAAMQRLTWQFPTVHLNGFTAGPLCSSHQAPGTLLVHLWASPRWSSQETVTYKSSTHLDLDVKTMSGLSVVMAVCCGDFNCISRSNRGCRLWVQAFKPWKIIVRGKSGFWHHLEMSLGSGM